MNFFKQLLSIHSKEQKGLLVLSALLLFLICANQFSGLLVAQEVFAFEDRIDDIHNWKASIESDKQQQIDKKEFAPKKATSSKTEIEKFNFDPNTASKEDLIKLGFSEFSIKNILNYRNYNHSYKSKEDFKKVYGISPEFYSSIEPYIQIIPEKELEKNDNYSRKSSLVNINTADSIGLQSLNGIGPKLSSRIIKYRTKLGGFISIEQLKEVFGLSSETFDLIKEKIICEGNLNPIQINSVSAETLADHPYISFTQAKALINYRNKHGNFRTIDDFKSTDLFSDDLCTKIAPYIEFNE